MDNYEKINHLFHEILLLQDRVENEKKSFKTVLDAASSLNSKNKELLSNLKQLDVISSNITTAKDDIEIMINSINLDPIRDDINKFITTSTSSVIESNTKLIDEMNMSDDIRKKELKSFYRDFQYLLVEITQQKDITKNIFDNFNQKTLIIEHLKGLGTGFFLAGIVMHLGLKNGWF